MTQETPRIAIIVPVYNVEAYIGECLNSIQQQTYPHFVAFCVDDGSPDQSGAICDAFAQKDSRFKIIHKPNGGVSSARNAALIEIEKDGTFDFISFIDGDDYVSPKFLEKLVSAAINENVDYAFCDTVKFKDGEKPAPKEFAVPAKKLSKTGILEQYLGLNAWKKYKEDVKSSLFNRLFSAEAVRSIRFDTRFITGEDVRYFAQVSSRLHAGVAVNRPLYFYRIRSGSLTHTPSEKAVPQAVPDAAADPYRDTPGVRSMALRLETTRLFMAQVPYGSQVYWAIHSVIIDHLWGALKQAYIKNDPADIKARKSALKKEMPPLRYLQARHYRMLFLMALGDTIMRRYSLKRENRKKRKK